MNEQIALYAKRLKLSWTKENYNNIKANSNEEFLLKLLEKEVEAREERKVNLLLSQAQLPKMGVPAVSVGAYTNSTIHHSQLLVFKGDSFRYKESLLNK